MLGFIIKIIEILVYFRAKKGWKRQINKINSKINSINWQLTTFNCIIFLKIILSAIKYKDFRKDSKPSNKWFLKWQSSSLRWYENYIGGLSILDCLIFNIFYFYRQLLCIKYVMLVQKCYLFINRIFFTKFNFNCSKIFNNDVSKIFTQ